MTLEALRSAAFKNCNNRYVIGGAVGFARFKHELNAMAHWINWQSRDEPFVYDGSALEKRIGWTLTKEEAEHTNGAVK